MAMLKMVLSCKAPGFPSAWKLLMTLCVWVSITFSPVAKVPAHSSFPRTHKPCTLGKAMLSGIWVILPVAMSMQFRPPSSVPIHSCPPVSSTISRTLRPCSLPSAGDGRIRTKGGADSDT